MGAGSDAVVPRTDGRRVAYDRSGLVEWYENTADGLEQGFTLPERPPGEGTLHIEGSVAGGVRPALASDGVVEFFAAAGACVLRYGKLRVWDARGTEIPSWLKLEGERLAIVIDDDAATLYPLTVDPIWTAPAWSYEFNQAFAHLGASVATAGDVNGDGRSDVIVGAPQFDNGQDLEGRAFVFHGTAAGISSVPSWTAESNVTNARFGGDVACAGDVNGDGFADVIIGAFAYSNGQTSEGRAYVYLGSAAGLAASPQWAVESNQIGGFFGASVGTAGDVNGDAFADVIVGASLYDNGEIDEGRAFVFHGSAAGLAAVAAWTVESHQAAAELGGCVATAGDVNGDGYADVVVGAKDYDNGQTGEGRAYVYLGSAAGLSAIANWTGEANQAAALFGRSVATAGDVNGDGYADVIIGASGSTGTPGPLGSTVPLVLNVNGLSPGSPYHWRVRVRSDSPFFPRSRWLSLPGNAPGETDLRTAFTIGVSENTDIPPAGLILKPGAPNPFRTATDIAYTLPHAGRCRLAVYDVIGREVAPLVDAVQGAGPHQIRWDGRGPSGERLPAGVYLLRIEIGRRVEAQKIVIAPR